MYNMLSSHTFIVFVGVIFFTFEMWPNINFWLLKTVYEMFIGYFTLWTKVSFFRDCSHELKWFPAKKLASNW